MTQDSRRVKKNYEYGDFVYGSAAPKIDIKRQLEEAPARHITSEITKKNRAKQYAWSTAYIIVLTVCMGMMVAMLMYRVKLAAMVTSQVDTINTLEKQLNDLRMDNDEGWSRVSNSIDMEEIKRIAIGELGMTYAQEGQIVTYVDEGMDYMRKVVED